MMMGMMVTMIMMMVVMVRICGPSNMVGATQHEGGSEVTQVSAGDDVDKDDDLEGEVDHEGGVDVDEEGNCRLLHRINCQVQYSIAATLKAFLIGKLSSNLKLS